MYVMFAKMVLKEILSGYEMVMMMELGDDSKRI